ncbi:WD40 repeat domain-containing protein [Nocardia sp. NPDC050406]|uniref:WD40 repeat domain-containing protein n=1 Tax=Nocardia sp. NPDC050406 TaxID=3364318 RepID=UPI00379B377C
MQVDPAFLRADDLSNQALSLLDLGRADEAEDLWRRALEIDPRHPHAFYNYGLHRWRTGQHTDMDFVHQLAELAGEFPTDARLARLTGLVYLESGDVGTARRWLTHGARLDGERSGSDDPDDIDLTAAAAVLERRHDHEPRTLEGQSGVCRVAVSADGRSGASGSYRRTVYLWDLTTGRRMHVLTSHANHLAEGSSADPLVLSADGSRVLTILDGALHVWDVATGRLLHCLEGEFGAVGAALAVSADGTIAVSAAFGTVAVWDIVEGRPVRTLQTGTDRSVRMYSTVSLSADGRIAMSHDSRGNRARVWEVDTGRLLHERHDCYATAVDSTGTWALTQTTRYPLGNPRTYVLWRIDSGRIVRRLKFHGDVRVQGCLSDDASVLVCGGQFQGRYVIRVWELDSGRCLRTVFADARDMLGALAANADCSVILGYETAAPLLRVWRTERGGPAAPWSYSPPRDATELAAQADSVSEARAEVDRLLARREWAQAARALRVARSTPGFERDSQLLDRWWQAASAGERDSLIGAWEDRRIRYGEAIAVSVNGIVFLGDGRTLRVLDATTGRELQTLEAHAGHIRHISCTPDARFAATADKRTLRIWEIETGRCLRTLDDHRSMVRSSIITHDGRTVLSVGRGIGCVLDVETGQCTHTAAPDTTGGGSTEIAVGAAGQWAFTAYDDHSINLWDMASGRHIRRFDGHTDRVTALAANVDGSVLVSASWDRTVRVWHRDNPAPQLTLTGHTHWVSAVTLTDDGHFAASGSRDHIIKIWDLRRGRCVRTVTGHPDGITFLHFTNNGRYLLVGDFTRNLRVWELDWDFTFGR